MTWPGNASPPTDNTVGIDNASEIFQYYPAPPEFYLVGGQ